MKFDGRDEGLMIEDVIATLTEQMDMAFKWAMGLEEYDDDDEDWKAAEALFANPSGLPYGAVMYGLFLNLKFANVFTMHPSLHHSQNAQIENLKIHDLHHKVCSEHIPETDLKWIQSDFLWFSLKSFVKCKCSKNISRTWCSRQIPRMCSGNKLSKFNALD